ncbi:hypothetical protein ACFV3R_15040 [Streptomyces sp. NPDC059740]|uniref:hypothetical protein n=1 Tax=Streptomyces sp. NPDC059740 TaxID=3346926 RepID=UPI0036626E9A
MVLSLSAAVLFGLIVFALIRARYVSLGAATATFLFGFFVASTGAAGPIRSLCNAIVSALGNLT